MDDSASPTMAEAAGAEPPRDAPSSTDLGGLTAGARGEQATQGDRRFHIGLALALGLHSLLFAGFYGSPPRHIGKPDGDRNAVDVSFVSEDELRSIASAASTPPAPKATPVPPSPQPQPPAEATPEPPAERTPPAPETPPVAQQQPAPEPTPEAAPVDESLTLKPMEDLLASTERKSRPQPAEPPKPQPPAKQPAPQRKRQAALDLSPPANFTFGGGGGAAVARPAGITRSGENDAFARGVISALRRTMPQLMDTKGRVTVRITLGKDGDLVSTQIINPSNVAGLDRSVVFATRQTSYPFPPRNARSVDLVFLITYIYQ
jgi:TonB family protein